jgi:hypothetical protein
MTHEDTLTCPGCKGPFILEYESRPGAVKAVTVWSACCSHATSAMLPTDTLVFATRQVGDEQVLTRQKADPH